MHRPLHHNCEFRDRMISVPTLLPNQNAAYLYPWDPKISNEQILCAADNGAEYEEDGSEENDDEEEFIEQEENDDEEEFDDEELNEARDVGEMEDDAADDVAGWVTVENSYKGPIPFPFTGNAGFNAPSQSHSTPIDIFRLFVTDDIINVFVEETNRFAKQFIETAEGQENSRFLKWKETTNTEMQTMLGLMFQMVW